MHATSAPAAYCEIDFPAAAGRLQAAFEAPLCVLSATRAADVPALLARVETHAREGRWAVGFVAYEAAPAFDAAHAVRTATDGMPVALFAIYAEAAPAFRARRHWLCGPWRDIGDRDGFDTALASIRRGIAAGDYYQVNYTTRLRARFLGDGLGFFHALRASQPAAYCAYLDFGRWRVCSVSPELFFDWSGGDGSRSLSSRPMKGTAARGADPRSDAAAAQRLGASAKDRAENLMIVDLIRNDVSKLALPGSVQVPALFSIEEWPTVWQMTSTVACRTGPDVSLPEVFGALFPCGSVTGAPKVAALAAIARLEGAARGVYCGAIGVVRPGGEATFSVAIRTVMLDARHGTAECGIGSGIVMDSDADAEYAEWAAKRAFLDRSCPSYELLETLRLHRGRYWLRRGHLARLARSAAALGFAFDAQRVDAALAAAARDRSEGRARLRLAPDGRVSVDLLPLDPSPRDPGFALAERPVDSSDPWLRHKTTRRAPYQELAVGSPAVFDTLLYNERDEITEFTRGNIVAQLDGRLLTPPLECGLLPGVLRAALLRRGRIREGMLRRADLARAEKLWFVNSVRGALEVKPR